jgi:hypothetical protein
MLTSCGKSDFNVEPSDSTSKIQQEGIQFDGILLAKASDVYSIGEDNNLASSTFLTNSNSGSAQIRIEVSNTFTSKPYNMGNHEVSVELTQDNQIWSSKLGHQKGSTFEIISSKALEAHSGYVREITIKTSCFLYNNEGNFKPFVCFTTVKY